MAADDALDPDAPALPQLYSDKDGHLLLVFLEDAARLLFTEDAHVTGFKSSAPKKGKKRGRADVEPVAEEDSEAEADVPPVVGPAQRQQPRCKKCGGLRMGHKRGQPCPPSEPAPGVSGDSD